MSTHTPQIGIAAARRRYSLAQELCPHWDYEADGNAHEPCCVELQQAKQELKIEIWRSQS